MKPKRNLDGIYVRVFRDGKWQNSCFTDLDQNEAYNVILDYGWDEQRTFDGLVSAMQGMFNALDSHSKAIWLSMMAQQIYDLGSCFEMKCVDPEDEE